MCKQIFIIIYSLEFSHQRKLMVFHWRLIDSKSPQVSRTLLSILAVFNNAAVWMVSTRSPTSKSSRPFNNPLVTVPKASITIGIIVTFIIIIIIIIIIHWEFFTSVLADDLLLETEWRQVSLSVQDSSQYHYYYYSFESFPRQRLLWDFHWSLSDSKSP